MNSIKHSQGKQQLGKLEGHDGCFRLCHLLEIACIQSAYICDDSNVQKLELLGFYKCLCVCVVAMAVSFFGKEMKRCTNPWSLFYFLDMKLNGKGRE